MSSGVEGLGAAAMVAAAVDGEGCFSCDLVRTSLMAAVAAAVVCVVGAVFCGQVFAAVGYALFGLGAGWYLMTYAQSEEELKKIVIQMRLTEEELARAAQRIADLIGQVEGLQNELRRQTGELERRVNQLRDAHRELEQLRQHFQASQRQLSMQSEELSRAQKQWAGEVGRLNEINQALKLELKQFLQAQLDLGVHVGAFAQSGEQMQKEREELETAIRTLDQRFDENLEQLQQALTAGHHATSGLDQFLHENIQKYQREVADMAENITKMAALEKQMREQIAKVEAERSEIGLLRSQIESTRGELEAIHKTNVEEEERVQKLRAEMAQERQRLELSAQALRQKKEEFLKELVAYRAQVQRQQQEMQQHERRYSQS